VTIKRISDKSVAVEQDLSLVLIVVMFLSLVIRELHVLPTEILFSVYQHNWNELFGRKEEWAGPKRS
jgi:hypothetical protein